MKKAAPFPDTSVTSCHCEEEEEAPAVDDRSQPAEAMTSKVARRLGRRIMTGDSVVAGKDREDDGWLRPSG